MITLSTTTRYPFAGRTRRLASAPRWTICFPHAERERATAIAQARLDNVPRLGVDYTVGEGDPLSYHTSGVIGELAFAQFFRLDTSGVNAQGVDRGVDFWMPDKRSVDVKTRCYAPYVDSMVSYTRNVEADILVAALRDEFRVGSCRLVGWLLRSQWRTMMGAGPKGGYAVEFARLNPIGELAERYHVTDP